MNTTEDLFLRLRNAAHHIGEAAGQIPPIPPERLHALMGGARPSQFQLLRQADRYLLILCLLVLALGASLLWHTAPVGVTPLGVAIVVLSLVVGWVALRAARSLWLMWQTCRLRSQPYRMARYADRLSRLSRHRRWWLGLVLRGSHGAPSVGAHGRAEFFRLRLPSYSIAACLLLVVGLNSNKTFATTRDYVKVTTTTQCSDTSLCDTLSNIIQQL
jgi:hypothetical protein